MKRPSALPEFHWDYIKLVVFDVDGTLYDQTTLRLQMARDMLLHAVRKRSIQHLKVLSAYRRTREELGNSETEDFEPILIGRTSAATSTSPEQVRAIASEWIDRRPLQYMKLCRYPFLDRLFAALRGSGRLVGILSDYPVPDKLAALELEAHHVVCAGDPEVRLLKPHPRGLQQIIAAAGVKPSETVLIGDRIERDGYAASRAGAYAIVKRKKPVDGWITFRTFDDPIFDSILESSPYSTSFI